MKLGLTTVLVFAAVSAAFGQSGRVKPVETPTPKPAVRTGDGAYVPTQIPSSFPGTIPAAPPTPKDDESVIKVESVLVPIPVSVVDQQGRSVANLRLGDFELMVDGKPAEISDVTRSETPIRLALLFDNSS